MEKSLPQKAAASWDKLYIPIKIPKANILLCFQVFLLPTGLSIPIPGGKSYFLGEDSGFLALNTLVAILDWGIWSWEQAGGLGGHRSQTLSQMCPSTPARDIPAFDLLVPRKTPEAAVKFQYGMGP